MTPQPLKLENCYLELGLRAQPFSITPDTEFFYPGSQHATALSHLRYGIATGAFSLLTGEVGLGKTLLCRHLLRNPPGKIRTAYIFNPVQGYEDMLATIHHDLTGEALERLTAGQYQKAIYDALLKMAEEGEYGAVVVDEAHRLSPELMEGLRLLSNLDTEKKRLLSLLLVGQPELDRTLELRSMRPLSQRISVRYRLKPLDRAETAYYVRHRIDVVRAEGEFDFTNAALWWVHRASKGYPRRINQICERATLAAFAAGRMHVSVPMIWQAAREVHKGYR